MAGYEGTVSEASGDRLLKWYVRVCKPECG